MARPGAAEHAAVLEVVQRARALATRAQRTLLGVTGPPGVGKSTLAQTIADDVGRSARVVGMDGFHLSQNRLRELGRLDRKGAVDTFDANGFVSLVRRLRDAIDETVHAPEFRRDLEESIAGAVAVEPDVRLIIVEGNYMLIQEDPWSELRALLDEVWYCEADEETRVANLIARHRAYGKSPDQARRWALGPDQTNAGLIARTRPQADLIVRMDRTLDPAQRPRGRRRP